MLHALEQIRRMRGGAQSYLMRCSDGLYYVVKFQNKLQHRRILVNEIEQLHRRHSRVPELILEAKRTNRQPFPNWV